MIKGTKKTVTVAMPKERYDRIKELADGTCRTVPSYIRMILFNYLRQLDRLGTQADDWWVVK